MKGAGAPIFVHGRLEERRSDFDFIFSCLYPSIETLVFPDEEDGGFISSHSASHVQALEVRAMSNGYRDRNVCLMSAFLLNDWGRYVSDDWNSALLFRPGLALTEMKELEENLCYRDDHKVLTDNDAAQVLFHNWDGVYWEIYCKDAALIERLLQTHRSNERLMIYKVEFALDYPDPREVQLEKA